MFDGVLLISRYLFRLGAVKWSDILRVSVQAVGAAVGLDRYAVPRSRKVTQREIKLDCCVFPMPVNNLASRKRDGTFPQRKVAYRCFKRYVGQSRVASMFSLQHYDTLDSMLFLPFYFFFF